MSARSDINIPETMMRLQSRIKAYVQESAGIEVREVRLNVDKVIPKPIMVYRKHCRAHEACGFLRTGDCR